MEIKFYPSKKEEFEDIVSHSKWWLDSAPTQEAFNNLIKANMFFTLSLDNEVVWSFSLLPLRNGSIMIQFLRIKKEHRWKWLGRKTIEFIEEKTKSMGRNEILSTVLKANEVSIGFHEKMWFKKLWNIDYERAEIIYVKDV